MVSFVKVIGHLLIKKEKEDHGKAEVMETAYSVVLV